MRGFFVTGTDTDVGKTLVCSWLLQVKGLYWKPIQCGHDHDRDKVATLSGRGQEVALPERYVLAKPRSPDEAAPKGTTIDVRDFILPDGGIDPLIVEGAGGLLVPLNRQQMVADLIIHLNLPVVVVARSALGTINHSCLTVEALRRRHITIAGVILTGPEDPANAQAIAHYADVPILGSLPWLKRIDRQAIVAMRGQAQATWRNLAEVIDGH